MCCLSEIEALFWVVVFLRASAFLLGLVVVVVVREHYCCLSLSYISLLSACCVHVHFN